MAARTAPSHTIWLVEGRKVGVKRGKNEDEKTPGVVAKVSVSQGATTGGDRAIAAIAKPQKKSCKSGGSGVPQEKSVGEGCSGVGDL